MTKRTSGLIAMALAVCGIVWCTSKAPAEAETSIELESTRGNVSGQVVFFYYPDLKAPEAFYRSIMGFEETFGLDWVKIYRTNGGASIGIVDEEKGFLKGAKNKPVMVSWETDDVDRWHRYLKEKGVTILSPPKDSPETGIRGFVFADPGGYTLEFFTWTR